MILSTWGIEPHLREFQLPVEQFNYLIKPGEDHWKTLRTIRDQVIICEPKKMNENFRINLTKLYS